MPLIAIIFTYSGKKVSHWQFVGYDFFTIRYAIIVLSFFINGFVLFLYIVNLAGNNAIFY